MVAGAVLAGCKGSPAAASLASSCSSPGFGVGPTGSQVFIIPSALTIGVGRTGCLVACYPGDLQRPEHDGSVVWTSSNPEVASVDPEGHHAFVRGLRAGKAFVGAAALGNPAAPIEVEVLASGGIGFSCLD